MKKFCIVVFVLAGINFVTFFIGTVLLGGSAESGKVEGGRYYVSSHGKLTEVSQAAFNYSRFQSATVWFTHPTAIICALLLYRQKQRKSSSGNLAQQ